jgi:carboxymethylenebutenolidase
MSTASPYPIVRNRIRIAVDDPGAAPGVRPAVIVGFEMFGVTAYIRRVADRLAAMGLLAIVPDFHHRTAPGFEAAADDEGRAAGFALLQRLTRDGVLRDVRASVAHVRGLPDAGERIGMVGFSLGGHLAFYAATQVDLAATAVVYPGWLDVTGTGLGTPDPLLDLVPAMAGHRGKLLYLMGSDDHVVTADQNRLAGERLSAAGVRHEIVVCPGGPHGFLADERDTYRPDLAADAWRRIAGLLAEELDASLVPPLDASLVLPAGQGVAGTPGEGALM